MSNDGCDSCPGVDAEHHLCDQCMEDDKAREEERVRDAVTAERAACAKAVCDHCCEGMPVERNDDGSWSHPFGASGMSFVCMGGPARERGQLT